MDIGQRRDSVEETQVDGLADGVDRAVTSGLSDLEDLRSSVSRFVTAAREAAMPPQDVIRQLKTELQRHASSRLERREFSQLSEHVVSWTLDAYYGVSDA